MAKIKVLKDKDNIIIYPQTSTAAVLDNKGNSVDTIIQKYVHADQLNEIEDINLNYEQKANKVMEVNSASTDTQYPSAKAVYNAILANKSIGLKLEIAETKEAVTNPNSTVLYLIGAAAPYEEWVYLPSGSWEKVGDSNVSVDLSEYAKKNEIPDVSNFVESSALSTVATSGSYDDLNNKPTIPSAYVLPIAAANVLGGVKIGNLLSITADGTLSGNEQFVTGTYTGDGTSEKKIISGLNFTPSLVFIVEGTECLIASISENGWQAISLNDTEVFSSNGGASNIIVTDGVQIKSSIAASIMNVTNRTYVYIAFR